MMSISKHQIEAFDFGDPQSIAAKILFVKRAARPEAYNQHRIEVQEFGNVWHGIAGLLQGERSPLSQRVGPGILGDAVSAQVRLPCRAL